MSKTEVGSGSAVLGNEIVGRINQLGAISETPEHLARIFLSPEHRVAADLVLSWMRDAGMAAHLDAIGNVCGRYEGDRPGLPCLMLGSHYDTVRDAGKWDGPLGLITAISCVADLNRRGRRLPFAVEVVGFADEEGVRFASTLLGSRAVAGTFVESALNSRDHTGVSMRDALVNFGLDPEHIGAAARARRELLAYVELHIEQGPVLERQNLPVGVVTAIAGATRLAANLTGMAGHAGTVPMALRRDALTGAAECITTIEELCRTDDGGLVAIDNDVSFPASNLRYGKVPLENMRPGGKLADWQRKIPPTITAEMAAQMRAMAANETEMRKKLAAYLDPVEIDGAFHRLDLLLRLMDTKGYPAIE